MRELFEEERWMLEGEGDGEGDYGCIAVESSVGELGGVGAGTICGDVGNSCFKALADAGYAGRSVRGWYNAKENSVYGMFHIQCYDEQDAEKISEITESAGGSLRPEESSIFLGFWEFEIE